MVSKDPKLKQYDLVMVGHTHFPMIYKGRIINPGSAGQPRDGKPDPWYAMLETDPFSITFKRFRYNNLKVVSELSRLISKDSPEFQELVKFYS
jgi:protein phosphatase